MMADNKRSEALIKRHEGKRLVAYKDTVGVWTIGIGYNLESAGGLITMHDAEGLRISEGMCNILFKESIEGVRKDINRLPVHLRSLTPARVAVLENMMFNMGLAKLIGFRKMLSAIKRRDYKGAAAEMIDSKWYRQVGKRADDLMYMMSTGEWLNE